MFRVHNKVKIVDVEDDSQCKIYNGKIGTISKIWKEGPDLEYPNEILFDNGLSWCFANHELELVE